MPVKSLAKVQKHVKAKKGARIGALHEHSRDARRLQRASARGDKLATKIAERERANLPYLRRVLFFQELLQLESAADTPPAPSDVSRIQVLIELYLLRHKEELEKLQSERRPGRAPVTREVALKQQMELDEQEYESGYWVPDLRDGDTLFSLQHWKGEWPGLNKLEFVRVARDGAVTESNFPPNGQS